jgi:hypothetical protein
VGVIEASKFDEQERRALGDLGFEIAADGESATISQCAVSIIRSEGRHDFHVHIVTDAGDSLHAISRRCDLIDEDDDEDDAEERVYDSGSSG